MKSAILRGEDMKGKFVYEKLPLIQIITLIRTGDEKAKTE
jgi:hypothetical protein